MTTYDISREEIKLSPPDEVPVDQLQPDDLIGRYEMMGLSIYQRFPTTVRIFNQSESHNGGENTTSIEAGNEQISVLYVASIGENETFKVYRDWGDANSIERVSQQGQKMRDETMARLLFPMLRDWAFTV